MEFIDRAATDLETHYGFFRIEVFKEANGKEHIAMSMGDISSEGGPVLCRLHSECLTGDLLFSAHCDCGDQLATAMSAIAEQGRGLLLYMRQEGRGVGLPAKLRAYEVQKHEGLDTYAANEKLGLQADARDYTLAAQILTLLGVSAVRLMTNNPKKVEGLEQCGIVVAERVSLVGQQLGTRAQKYLLAKRKQGHII